MGGAHTHCVNVVSIHVFTQHMSPALNGCSMLEHFKRSNATEVHYGIMFNFYPGLPHVMHLTVIDIVCCNIVTLLHRIGELIEALRHLNSRKEKEEKETEEEENEEEEDSSSEEGSKGGPGGENPSINSDRYGVG